MEIAALKTISAAGSPCFIEFSSSLKFYRNESRDTCFLHGHTIERTCHLHGPLVMRNHDELRIRGHLDDLISKASHVRFVKRRVDLIQQAEGRRTVMEDAQHQRQRRHCFLTTGEQKHVLQTFARWLSNNVDAR